MIETTTPRQRLLSDTDVFAFDDYRKFLGAAYTELKTKDPDFSFRTFARRAGFASPNFLKLVIDGDRNLSPDAARKFAAGFRLRDEASEFFVTMVAMNQARTADDKNKHYRKLRAMLTYRKARRLEGEAYDYYTAWYHAAIREMAGLPAFREDPEWIAAHLRFSVPAREIREALQRMESLGILVRDANGVLKQSDPFLSTGAEVLSLAVRNFHAAMMQLATDAMASQPREERDISGLTVAVSKGQATEIKERIKAFRKEILDLVGAEEKPEAVYQLNIQWFALSGEKS